MRYRAITESAPSQETRAGRFIMTAEQWLAKSVSKFGVHTPEMDELGPQRIRMTPVEFPPKRADVAVAVIQHLGKLADLLRVTIVVEGVPDQSEKLYAGFVANGGHLVRVPSEN